MFEGLNSLEFGKKFSNNENCYKYLLELKWGKGFQCSKCGHKKSIKGKTWYYKRCSKCMYDESATSGTLFHKLKFPIHKAFHICFRLSVKKKGMSTVELAKEFDLQQRTCWLFKRKVQEAMKSSGRFPLENNVEVDEFLVGGYEQGKKGRSHGKKKLVVVGIEKVSRNKIGRAYAKVIESSSSEEIRPFFENNISLSAKIKTDKWRGYIPLKEDYNKLKQVPSEKGLAFPELHTHIMNLKGWLRGIHHQCSSDHIQAYLDEFHFRFNRRNHLKTIFKKLIERMIGAKPLPYSMICALNT